MRLRLFCFLLLMYSISYSQDSTQTVMGFRITDYIVKPNDSVQIVQIQLPEVLPLRIKEKQLGILKSVYQNGNNTSPEVKGMGRCHLIKGNYYYFGVKMNAGQQAQQGDLIYTTCTVATKHDGLLFKTAAHAIQFTRVTEDLFFNNADVFFMTAGEESAFLDSMVADIRYTGRAMLEQMPDQNQDIKGGIFDGKKLFSAMLEINRDDLTAFLRYIIARPDKYAGNLWKISEIMATWMVSETPQVKQP